MQEISSEDSSDDLLLKDLNPCLTPYNAKSRSRVTKPLQHCLVKLFKNIGSSFPSLSKTRFSSNLLHFSQEFEGMGSGSLHDESLSEDDVKVYPEIGFSSYDPKFSKSSDCCQNSSKRSVTTKPSRRSDESKSAYGGRMNLNLHKY